jgi:hypothetical protein
VQVSSQALAFFFLEFDRGGQQDLLLFLFHFLKCLLVAGYSSLVKNYEQYQADSEYEHANSTDEQYEGYSGWVGLKEKHRLG